VPPWYEEALESRTANPRVYRWAKEIEPFLDPEETQYIHLVDGGISDNLGMRASLDRIALMASGPDEQTRYSKLDVPDHIAVIVVNAENKPDPRTALERKSPGVLASLNLASGSQIRRYNFETLLLTQEVLKSVVARFSSRNRNITGHFIEVSFDLLPDKTEREYFKRLPTTFTLSDIQVDRLKEAGRTILRNSPTFQAMLRAVSDPEE
jgi:NTE family protein